MLAHQGGHHELKLLVQAALELGRGVHRKVAGAPALEHLLRQLAASKCRRGERQRAALLARLRRRHIASTGAHACLACCATSCHGSSAEPAQPSTAQPPALQHSRLEVDAQPHQRAVDAVCRCRLEPRQQPLLPDLAAVGLRVCAHAGGRRQAKAWVGWKRAPAADGSCGCASSRPGQGRRSDSEPTRQHHHSILCGSWVTVNAGRVAA